MNMACMGKRVRKSAEDNGDQYSRRGQGQDQASTSPFQLRSLILNPDLINILANWPTDWNAR